jgi:hypothetical protein
VTLDNSSARAHTLEKEEVKVDRPSFPPLCPRTEEVKTKEKNRKRRKGKSAPGGGLYVSMKCD